jgi:ribonuclease D
MNVRLARTSDLPAAIAEIAAAPRVGIDTEFHAEGRWIPELFLLQVHIPGGTTWLFDAKASGGIRSLGEVLCSRPWVLHAGNQDLRILSAWFGGLPDVVLDTQVAAGLLCERFPEGYASLVSRYLDRVVEKQQRLSDWSVRPLTSAQIDYAAADVLLLFDLWEAMEQELQAQGRYSVVEAACTARRAKVLDPPGPEEAWRALHAVPALDDDSLRTLKALAAWRRRLAVDRDSQERSVVGDGLLVQLSRARPRSVSDLRGNRRMPKSVVRRFGEDICSIVREVADNPPEAPKTARYRTPSRRRLTWLECLARGLGRDGGWAHALVLPTLMLEDLALNPPADREALASLLEWRDALVGDDLWAALTGGIALSLGSDVTIVRS